MNKPNATILGVPDGLLVQNGQPYGILATWTATTRRSQASSSP